jgi:hypothetical protein
MEFKISLKDTYQLMSSPDYKDRFRAEYFQLILRLHGLTEMLKGYKAGTLPFKPSCSYEMLHKQLDTMNLYRLCLEERARIENIELV